MITPGYLGRASSSALCHAFNKHSGNLWEPYSLMRSLSLVFKITFMGSQPADPFKRDAVEVKPFTRLWQRGRCISVSSNQTVNTN